VTAPDNLVYFLGVSVALTVAPGPDVIFLASQGLAGGPRAGLAVALGLSTGLLAHTALAALGVSAVFAASPAAFGLVKWAGAAYMVWLAWCAFRERPVAAGARGPAGSAAALYRRGIVMNLLNPKVALFFLALLPQFVDPARGPVRAQMAVLGLVFMAQVVVVFGTIGYLSGRLGERFLPGAGHARAIAAAKGLVFLSVAVLLSL